MILHFSQIFLTLGRTFIAFSLEAVGDTTAGEVVWSQLNLNLVARKNTDVVHSHLSGDMRQNFVTVLELYPKHGVRQGLEDRSFEQNGVVFGLGQN